MHDLSRFGVHIMNAHVPQMKRHLKTNNAVQRTLTSSIHISLIIQQQHIERSGLAV